MTDRSLGRRSPTRAVLRGCARALDGAEGTGLDPRGLQPARAIRRALAAGGLKAHEVDGVWGAYDARAGADGRRHATEAVALALGPHAARVAVHLRPTIGDPHMSMAVCARSAIRSIAGGESRAAVAVVIGLGGVNTALAFSAR